MVSVTLYSYQGTIKGFIWADMEDYLENLAWSLYLEITMEISTYFLRETIRYKVSGSEDNVRKFRETVVAYL